MYPGRSLVVFFYYCGIMEDEWYLCNKVVKDHKLSPTR